MDEAVIDARREGGIGEGPFIDIFMGGEEVGRNADGVGGGEVEGVDDGTDGGVGHFDDVDDVEGSKSSEGATGVGGIEVSILGALGYVGFRGTSVGHEFMRIAVVRAEIVNGTAPAAAS